MIRFFSAILMALSLSACSSLPDDIPCNTEPAHYDAQGAFVPTAYTCPEASPRATYALNQCSWVNGYYKKGGAYVSGHTRCKYNLTPPGYTKTDSYNGSTATYSESLTTGSDRSNKSLGSGYSGSTYKSSGSSYNKSPCVTGYCGPVKVKGYYRKNGTYVRPHTRSYPRSRR